MKRNIIAVPFVFLGLLLSSCSSSSIPLDSEDYVKNLAIYHDGFRILQLTDIHWNFTTDIPLQKTFLAKVVDEAKPDFIMITGDSILDADETITKTLYDFVNSWEIPFGVTWGNHDRQGTFSPSWLSHLLANETNSCYTEVPDAIEGRSNYVINLRDASNDVKWQIYSLDSNSYTYDPFSLSYRYDSIRDEQVAWYQAQAEKAKSQTGSYVPSAIYFHIPLWEWAYAYWENPTGELGEIHEKATYSVPGLTDSHGKIPFWPGDVHSELFDRAAGRNTKAMFCGHDHANDWGSFYSNSYGKTYLSYGVKSGRELYYAKNNAGVDMTGGSLMVLHSDESWDLKHIYVNTDTLNVITEEASFHA